MSKTKSLGRLLTICMYCDKHKNNAGYWEQAYGSVSEVRLSHGICPECCKEHFPDDYSLLCEEGIIVVKKDIMPNNRLYFDHNHISYQEVQDEYLEFSQKKRGEDQQQKIR